MFTHEWAWQGYHVWAKLIEACADLGYGPVNLVSAPPPCPAAEAAELYRCSADMAEELFAPALVL